MELPSGDSSRRTELIGFLGRRNSRAVAPSVLLHRFPCCLPLKFSALIEHQWAPLSSGERPWDFPKPQHRAGCVLPISVEGTTSDALPAETALSNHR